MGSDRPDSASLERAFNKNRGRHSNSAHRPNRTLVFELKSISGGSDYVLPTKVISRKERTGGDAPVNRNTIGQCINYWLDQYKPPIRPFTPHDLRSTARVTCGRSAFHATSPKCASIISTGRRRNLRCPTYFTERKQALEIWNGYLKKLEDRT